MSLSSGEDDPMDGGPSDDEHNHGEQLSSGDDDPMSGGPSDDEHSQGEQLSSEDDDPMSGGPSDDRNSQELQELANTGGNAVSASTPQRSYQPKDRDADSHPAEVLNGFGLEMVCNNQNVEESLDPIRNTALALDVDAGSVQVSEGDSLLGDGSGKSELRSDHEQARLKDILDNEHADLITSRHRMSQPLESIEREHAVLQQATRTNVSLATIFREEKYHEFFELERPHRKFLYWKTASIYVLAGKLIRSLKYFALAIKNFRLNEEASDIYDLSSCQETQRLVKQRLQEQKDNTGSTSGNDGGSGGGNEDTDMSDPDSADCDGSPHEAESLSGSKRSRSNSTNGSDGRAGKWARTNALQLMLCLFVLPAHPEWSALFLQPDWFVSYQVRVRYETAVSYVTVRNMRVSYLNDVV